MYFRDEEWLRDLFDHAHDLIQIVDVDGTLLFVNRSWSEHLGYRQEEILDRSIYSFIYEEDRQSYRDYRQGVIEGLLKGTPIVFRLQTKAGECIYVEGVVTAKHLAGKALYTRGIFRDITARMENEKQLKQLNSSLQERQQNLHQLLVHAPDAMIVIDQDSRIAFWNPKAEEIFGWTAAEVLHQPLAATIIPPQHREAHEKGMKRYLTTGEAHVLNRTIEITALNKKGEEFYVSLTISQAVQDNKVVFISFLRDISEQKKNQLELEEKTRQLEQTNKSLEAFAYAASHDLKEPIRKIHIFSDRLKQKWFDRFEAEDRHYLERIESATIRMKTLIDDLLSYSTVSSGVTLYEDVNLAEVIREVLEDLELLVQEKGAVIRVDALPVIQGQARQLHQAFQNLLDNALKYSQPDIQPHVHIRSRVVYGADLPQAALGLSASLPFYLIEVEDNGIGFEQINAERIFQVFTRLQGGANLRGSGVGLSIVQKVISNHGGFVWAESAPGKGTTFYIALPRQENKAG
ncbi:MAG TPA: PAS domain S-box protein [Flavisolibacter sp.]|jgi:PAS domain S-box-containing protein|nr:PAS domain S-box protein [Flavisolibacter sp.]